MMMKALQFFKYKAYEFRWAILSGVLVGTTYIPFPPWALLFCYAPVWWDIAKNSELSTKQVFLRGWVTQFLLSLIGFHWIAHTAHEFGQLPWAVSILALLLFCAFMHLYVPASLALIHWLRKKFHFSSVTALIGFALTHSLLERTWPVIFDWNLGYTLLWQQLPAYHLADLVGFLGLSTIILLGNAVIAGIFLRKQPILDRGIGLAAVAFVFIALNALGFFHGKKWNITDSTVRVGIVQANIGNMEKIYAEQGRGYQAAIVSKFLGLTEQLLAAKPDTEIIVWPETAFPEYLDEHYRDRTYYRQLIGGLQNFQKPLITGAYSKDPQTDENKDQSSYNALFLVDSEGHNLSAPYRKTELLAFGEYLPFSETFPILLKWLPFISNFGRGQGPDVLHWQSEKHDIRWGAQICYEGLYPEFSRGLSAKGADILLNVTNDSWFGKTFEPHQHLYMTVARAVETRRPLVRSTNTGISTVALANGHVLRQSPLHTEWVGQYDVSYLKNAPQTFYVRIGHWDWILWSLVLLVILLRGARNAKSRHA